MEETNDSGVKNDTPSSEGPNKTPDIQQPVVDPIYDLANLKRAYPGGKVFERIGQPGILNTNERMNPDDIKEQRPDLADLDGYIIGPGCGTIFAHLELWQKPPEGIISIDIDPSVIIMGKTLIHMAQKGFSKEKATAYFFGKYMGSEDNLPLKFFENDLINLAKQAIDQEPEYLKKILLNEIENGQFSHFVSSIHQSLKKYDKPIFEEGGKHEGRINTQAIIWKHWDTIAKLATEGRLSFYLGSLKDKGLLEKIKDSIPEVTSKKNMFYGSNVINHLKRANLPVEQRNLDELQILDPQKKAIYTFTKPENNYWIEADDNFPDS